jgi:diguanylate cyclase (GGDEF)-like protein
VYAGEPRTVSSRLAPNLTGESGEMVRSSGNAKEAIEASTEATEPTDKEGVEIPTRILVVDDEEVVCRFLESLLVGGGHQVQVCLSGQEAIALLKRDPFDLIITDLKMPGVDGLGVLRKAKELDPFCEVIVITAYATVESAVEVMKLGACDYISKPFNIDQIRIVVDKAIERRRLLRAAEERDFYKRLSQIDGLTEVYNYRAFHDLLQGEISRSQRRPYSLSVLMIDVDDLKVYNDTFGHPAGDDVLKEVARLLKRSVRNCDVVARYGGDEFAVILVETNKADAIGIANRLGRLVEETAFEHDDIMPHRTLTVSIGLASYPADAGQAIQLVAKADEALYEAKTLGGNVVRVAKE